MATFEFNGKTFYIDNRLKEKIDKRLLADLKKRDKDVVFVIDGEERVGKSVKAMLIAAYFAAILGTEFNLSNICMTPEEFRNKIETAKKNEVIIYDEAHRGMASGRALSEVNRILKDLMMEMGQKNLVVIIVLPYFFMLDKYAALARARALFHVYERKGKRGFWVCFNRKKKLRLYIRGKKEYNYNCMKWPRFRGRFYNQYPVNEEEYRVKKAKSFKERDKKPVAEKYLKWMGQRNVLIKELYKNQGYKQKDIANLFKVHGVPITRREVGLILKGKKA